MRWRVEVTSTGGNERLLEDVLKAFSIDILNLGGLRSLVSAKFETCSTSSEVRAIASRAQASIRLAGKHDAQLASELALELGSVFERRGDGSWGEHKFLETKSGSMKFEVLTATLTVGPSRLSEEERRRLDNERREQEYQDLRLKAISRVVSLFLNERAAQIQSLLAGDLTPLTMGHIADLIEADLGDAMRELTSGKQLSRFYRSINHPKIFGEEARHIVSSHEPPPDPMNGAEARHFVQSLATKWMERKAGL